MGRVIGYLVQFQVKVIFQEVEVFYGLDLTWLVMFFPMGLSYDWLVYHIGEGKQIYSRYDGCTIPFYESLFTQLKFRLPFTACEEGLLNNLAMSPS